jgi:transposase-like protein
MANSELTTKQRAALAALLAGGSYTDAAKAASVHPNRLTAWMKDKAFVDALHQAEGERLQGVTRSLLALADKAAGAIESVLDDPGALDSSKIRAADVVLGRLLQIKELAELEERIRKLEEGTK